MSILGGSRQQPEIKRRFRSKLIWSAVGMAAPFVGCGTALAQFQPTLPTIGSNVYNAAMSYTFGSNTTTAITTGSSDNSAALNNLISRASAAGGGTILIPSGTYLSKTLTLMNGINLDITPSATIQDATPTATLINTSGSATSNIEISGGGTLNGNATTTSSNNMIMLEKVTNLEINGVTIENSSHEHLVPEQDNNVTINAITLHDPLGILANADGLDYSGDNFLIENSTFSDGDDNIVAKPSSSSQATANVLIQNDTILLGHGISIGGQTNGGLNNLTVNNVTFNGTYNGFRLKAGRANGGVVTNVSVSNVTMTNVPNPIFISSWYNNGGDTYPSPPSNATTANYTAGSTPLWNQVSFNNIISTDTVDSNANAGLIFGLPEAPALGFTFNNVNLSDTMGTPSFEINYAGYTGTYNALAAPNSVDEILFENSSINGSALTQASLSNNNQFLQQPNGLYDAVVVIANVPEPASAALMAGSVALIAARRRSRTQKA
jgi:polygalacturonase